MAEKEISKLEDLHEEVASNKEVIMEAISGSGWLEERLLTTRKCPVYKLRELTFRVHTPPAGVGLRDPSMPCSIVRLIPADALEPRNPPRLKPISGKPPHFYLRVWGVGAGPGAGTPNILKLKESRL